MLLQIKSAALYTLRLVLQDADTPALLTALDQRMHDAGSFFQHQPVVIDASAVQDTLDWQALIAALRQYQLPPVGVVAQGANLDAAHAAGLPGVELGAAPKRPQASLEDAAPATAATPAPAPIAPAAMVVRRQLRSGQRIYARDTDLIVIGVVGHGAEVIADGNIHVYGPLRGRAMAGARGDESARIFALQLDPELLAIAGIYRVMETRLDTNLHNQACIVQLNQEKLNIEPITR